MHLKLVDLFLLLGISQGIFLAISLHLISRNNKSANKTLAGILVISVIMLLGRLFYTRFYTNPLLFRIACSVDTVIFLTGPLIFTYCERLLLKKELRTKIPIWYFLPAILHLFFVLFTYTKSINHFISLVASGAFHYFYLLFEFLGIIINIVFIYKSFTLVLNYRKAEENNLSYKQKFLPFLYSFLSLYSLSVALWVISFISYYILKNYNTYINYDSIWISIPIFIYAIGFYSLKQPEVFRLYAVPSKKSDDYERLSSRDIEVIKSKLETLINDEKVFLDNQLNLKSLANLLNTTSNNISWFLNNVYQTNFYEFINKHRILEFTNRIKNGDHKKHTITAISMDVGFNSKSTFNKSFKLVMKDTPSNYIKTRMN